MLPPEERELKRIVRISPETLGEILTRDGSAKMKDAVSVWAVGEEDGMVTVDWAFERLMDVEDIIGIRLNGEDLIFNE